MQPMMNGNIKEEEEEEEEKTDEGQGHDPEPNDPEAETEKGPGQKIVIGKTEKEGDYLPFNPFCVVCKAWQTHV